MSVNKTAGSLSLFCIVDISIPPPPLRAPTPNSLPPKLTRVFLQLQTTLIR